MNLFQKFKETVSSVVPIMVIVLILGFTAAPLDSGTILRFLTGGVLVILGLTVFLLGVDIGILPIGERCGAALTEKKSLPLLLSVSFIIGVIVTVAEPDVQVLADQIKGVNAGVNKWALILMIAAGLGVFTMFGLLRTVLSLSLKYLLIVSYILLFALAFLSPKEFQGVAFDAGGATTGPMTVPFIMALGVGVAGVRASGKSSGKNEGDDSFGLTGMASIGPIMAVCVYGIILNFFSKGSSSSEQIAAHGADAVAGSLSLGIFIHILPGILKEVTMALLPLVAMFAVFQIVLLKMPPFQIRKMIRGLAFSFIGLIIFLCGVNGGFMTTGRILGEVLGAKACGGNLLWTVILTLTGIVFGAIVVCAEPAVWVLTEQVETVSGGTIKRKVMLVALSAGVAISIGLSMIRLLYGFSLWYILVPGYALSLLLTFFCPPLFTGIAFDSGGVASGPMTSTFILSFTLGAASAAGNGSANDAFGVIALVAMTPLIAIQILGIIFKIKSRTNEEKK